MSLSDKQMLLLDNFMYGDIAPGMDGLTVGQLLVRFRDPSGKISVSRIKSAVNSGQLHLSGGFESDFEAYADVLQQMSEDKKIMDLRIAKTTPEYHGSIRAACFEDSEGDATVAFRGTGGSFKQWSNNFEGYGDESQQSQRDAKAFIDSLDYDQVDVTGHSNGGNQAMYVAIVCGNKVRKCVSYEGQGFSYEFIRAHQAEIDKYSENIRNICGKHDKINAVLISVAGTTVYVESTSGETVGHGSYGILEAANKNDGFDANGDFKDSYHTEPSWGVKAVKKATEILSKASKIPVIGRGCELFADLIGIGAGIFFDYKRFFSPNFFERAKAWWDLFSKIVGTVFDQLVRSLKESVEIIKKAFEVLKAVFKPLGDWLKKHFNAGYKYANSNPEIIVDTYKLRLYSERLMGLNSRLKSLDRRMNALYSKVKVTDLLSLMKADIFIGNSNKIVKCANYLSSTADLFEAAEKEIISKTE